MRTIAAVVLLGIAAGACSERVAAPPTADPASRRTTASGDVVGFVGQYGSHVWMGLPYAAPPTGERRWRAPAPAERWAGPREALQPGSPCVQYASPLGGVKTAPVGTPVGSEDCLHLNVYAPRSATPQSRLPVMMWIHGGGNTLGAAELYDGGNLAATHEVVVVTVNYRLGPFGWLRHAALRAGAASDAERSGNFATLDLVRALEWIRDHIGAFGGDAGRVTVFGESAGGGNTLSLLLAPQARGLFHRAIVQSGGVGRTDLAAAEDFAEAGDPRGENSSSEAIARLLVRDGRAGDRGAAKTQLAAMAPGDLERYLRGKSALDILAAYAPAPGIGMIFMPTIFFDGILLPRDDALVRLARADGWNRMPVILGTNRDETKLFMFGDPQWVRRWFWILPRLREPEQYDLVAEYLSRMWKANGADEIATAMRASGAADVFVYRFDWDEQPTVFGADLSRMIGAAHAMEIPFMFGHFDDSREARTIFNGANEAGRREVTTSMMAYWAEFATNGRPAAAGWRARRNGRHGRSRHGFWCSTPKPAAACARRKET